MRLSWEQVAALALEYGWNRDEAPIAVAIARAESSFRTNAKSPSGCCWGLWQVNTVHGYTSEQLKDPHTNAIAAYRVYEGRLKRSGEKWVDWDVYKNGRYRRHVPRARVAVERVYDGQDAPLYRWDPERLIEKIPFLGEPFKVGESKYLFSPKDRGPGDYARRVGKEAAEDVGGVGMKIVSAIWPVLLQFALAGTGLALMAYGVKNLLGAKPAEHAKRAAPIGAAIGKAVS